MLKFVVATLTDFDRVNIYVSNERLSIDGKAITESEYQQITDQVYVA